MDKGTPKSKTVSAIVPVYEEEKTVEEVVKTLLSSPLIKEVICVDDGSKDGSYQILKKFGGKVKILRHPKNMGKGAALATGLRQAKGEIVAFFDADLLNLSQIHIKTLLEPILEDKTSAVLGYTTYNSKPPKIGKSKDSLFYRFASHLPKIVHAKTAKNFSGERVFLRDDLTPILKEMEDTKFGIEIYLNKKFRGKTQEVPLPHLYGYLKFEKYPFPKALQRSLNEGGEIAFQIAKSEMPKLEDLRILRKIPKAKNLKDLDKILTRLQSRRTKDFLLDYFENFLMKPLFRILEKRYSRKRR